MSAIKRVGVVTGANRGIGLELCRQLAFKGHQVVLTSRNERKGRTVATQLQVEGLDVLYHQLDVTEPQSVEQLRTFIYKKLHRLDVLVNHTGICLDTPDRTKQLTNLIRQKICWSQRPMKHVGIKLSIPNVSVFDVKSDTFHQTLETNVYGPLRLCQSLVPLMQKHNYGRIINVSSSAGQLYEMKSSYRPSYRISKTALNALTRLLAAELKDTNILVNSAYLGWVKTRMGGRKAPMTPAQGADTIVWLATLPNNGPTGGFFRDRKPIDW